MFPGSKKYPLSSGFQLSGFHLAPRLHLGTTHFLGALYRRSERLAFLFDVMPYVRLSSCAFFFHPGIHFIFISTTSRLSRCISNENAGEFLPNGDNLFPEAYFAGSWRDIC